jgi:hypothetical protein
MGSHAMASIELGFAPRRWPVSARSGETAEAQRPSPFRDVANGQSWGLEPDAHRLIGRRHSVVPCRQSPSHEPRRSIHEPHCGAPTFTGRT